MVAPFAMRDIHCLLLAITSNRPSTCVRRSLHLVALLILIWPASFEMGLSQEATQTTASLPHAAGDEFERVVWPILESRCLECHSDGDAASGLSMESLAGLLKGGTRGPALVPGKPKQSLLISAIQHGEQLKMPPKEKLPAGEIAALVRWVELGAPWPDASPAEVPVSSDDRLLEPKWSSEQQAFWAFQRPVRPPLPEVRRKEWVQSPVDTFILSELEASGLEPAFPCDARTWLRRVTFDLTGLPPTPEELEAFLTDSSPDARSRVVERLLASPRYGERWGRHWLDVARYADSNGLDENLAYAHAFRYRDYVIRAWNADLPYDTFVREQLAGDIDRDPSDPRYFDRLVATAFLSLGAKMLAEDDPVKMQMDIIDEQIDTIGKAFLGLTLGCARCHDHKFDPIAMSDYYGLAGILKSTRTMENFSVVARWQELPLATPEQVAHRDAWRRRIADREAAIQQVIDTERTRLIDEARRHVGDYLLAAWAGQRQADQRAAWRPRAATSDLDTLPDAVLVEAEDYDRGNVDRRRDGYGEGIGVLVNRGETPNYVEYDIELPEAGTYQLDLRYAAASARPCKLFINGVTVLDTAAGQVTGGWFPDAQAWYCEGRFTFHRGKNVIRLEQPRFFPHIDKLLISPAPPSSQQPAIPPLHADYALVPEFVEKWRSLIADDNHPLGAPLQAWRRAIRSEAGRFEFADADSTDALIMRLAAAPRPQDVRALAARYEQLAEQALAAAGGASAQSASEPLRAWRDTLTDPAGPFAPFDGLETRFPAERQAELAAWRKEKAEWERTLPKLPETMAVSELPAENVPIHYRGSHLTLGPVVPRRLPTIFTSARRFVIDRNASGRRELADWIVGRDNPLSARVMVNRVWLWHFGKGLVASPDNFGQLGERPTHPELLDWLAVEFMESGWSIKHLHRLMVLSSTYAMSGDAHPNALEQDPENRRWTRFPRRRLEAEELRDALLFVAGNLDSAMGGSLLPIENRKYVTSTANVNPQIYESNRRTVYLPVVRSALYEVLQAFDFADPSVLSGQRQTTTIAPQALFMMNSAFVACQAEALARSLLSEQRDGRTDDEAETLRIDLAYRRVLGRAANPDEQRRARQYLRSYAARWSEAMGSEPGDNSAQLAAWKSFCRSLMSSNEFIFVE